MYGGSHIAIEWEIFFHIFIIAFERSIKLNSLSQRKKNAFYGIS